MEDGARIAYDPWLHTWAWVEALEKQVNPKGVTLIPLASNPIDAVWADRPEPSAAVATRLGSRNRGPGVLPEPFQDIATDLWGQTRDEWAINRTRLKR